MGTTGPSSCVDAVVDLSGPTDFAKAAGQLKQASPLTYISSARRLPAFLIGHGDADDQIPIGHLEGLREDWDQYRTGAEPRHHRLLLPSQPALTEPNESRRSCTT
ncbi:hypothetical protein OG407_02835 [Streptomyces sp. NBC_01515]|uniref:hypothetical protein n=1 Tax=Streptomyces sp. NBC_01515 TaxID=2903890 RepID=UPI0038639DA5